MHPSWRNLLKKHARTTLVELNRRPQIDDHVTGFVIGFSEAFILLHRLNWDTFSLNGYSLIRQDNVNQFRFFDKSIFWQNKAARKLNLKPKPLAGIPLSSWSEVLPFIARKFPLLCLHTEITKPEVCHIGRLLGITPKTLIINDLDCNGEWTKERTIRLGQITRVDFGGGYETALAITAPRDKKLIR